MMITYHAIDSDLCNLVMLSMNDCSDTAIVQYDNLSLLEHGTGLYVQKGSLGGW